MKQIGRYIYDATAYIIKLWHIWLGATVTYDNHLYLQLDTSLLVPWNCVKPSFVVVTLFNGKVAAFVPASIPIELSLGSEYEQSSGDRRANCTNIFSNDVLPPHHLTSLHLFPLSGTFSTQSTAAFGKESK